MPCKCLSIIILDSVLYANEKCHCQIWCKYLQEKIKTKNYIDKELKSESDTDTDNHEEIKKKVNLIMMNTFQKVFEYNKSLIAC